MSAKKIVLIAGNPSHGRGSHEHVGGMLLFADLINKYVDGASAVVSQGWPTDASVLKDASAFAIYSDGGEGHLIMPHLDEAAELAKKGVGVAMLHYAVEVIKGKPGDCFLEWIGGYFEMNWSVNPHWTAEFKSLPKHPINNGVKPFTMDDEWYYHMRFRKNMEGVTSVLSTLPPDSTLERPDGTHSGNPDVRKAVANKEPQHLGWCVERPDGGRGFGFTGGHFHDKWAVDDVRKFVLNALIWTAKLEVPKNGVETPTPTPQELESYMK